MKKRFFVCLLTAAVVTGSALAVTGCDNNEEAQSGWGYEYNLQTAYAAAVEKGYGGTFEEFIESISGKDGKDGQSAYEVWLENGNEGTEEEFLAWLKGESGETGKSAYEVWLENGNEGTEEDFLEWLKADISICQHTYSDWSVILQPTCTAGGVETHTCENCGVAEYRFTQANGHGTGSSAEYIDTKDSVYHFAVCGDCNVVYRERHEYKNHVCTKCETLEYVPPVSDPHYFRGYGETYKSSYGMITTHYALDLTAEEGDSVYAMAEGVVTGIFLNSNTGNIITIDHGNGLITRYRFAEPIEGLKEGDNVRKGDVIAMVAAACGSEKADGPHLCFEVELNGKSKNPTDYFDAVYEPIEESKEA